MLISYVDKIIYRPPTQKIRVQDTNLVHIGTKRIEFQECKKKEMAGSFGGDGVANIYMVLHLKMEMEIVSDE